MEYSGKGGSETSSEENDRLEQVKDDMGGTKRSYECTFCRRGFTNAQALGGHMNMHRKDRAKAKQIRSPSLAKKSKEEDYIPSRHISSVSCEPSKYSTVFEAQRNYDNRYFQPHPHANFHPSDLFGSRSQSCSMNQELLGANLSLQVGPMQVEDDGMKRGVNKAEEVDLVLRLGHDPY